MSEQTIRVTAATAYVSLGISRSVLFVLYCGVCVSDFVHDYKDLVSHTRYIIVKSSCGGPLSLCGAIMLQLRQSCKYMRTLPASMHGRVGVVYFVATRNRYS